MAKKFSKTIKLIPNFGKVKVTQDGTSVKEVLPLPSKRTKRRDGLSDIDIEKINDRIDLEWMALGKKID